MSSSVVRVGDPGSHGGVVLQGSPDCFVDGQPVARVGDPYGCPIHGTNPIVQGASQCFDGTAIARVGDLTACGAVLISGSTTTLEGS